MVTNQELQYFISYFHNLFNTKKFHLNNFYEYATDQDWEKIPYFSKKYKSDNWGEHSKIRLGVVLLSSALRHFVGQPVTVISGSGGKHNKNSYHYKGMAVDLYCQNIDLLEFYLIAEMLPFSGLGIYPNMHTIHCDIGTPDKRPARWIGMKNRKTNKIKYFTMAGKDYHKMFKKYAVDKTWEKIYR